MAQAFKPPTGIVGVRVAAIAVRHKTTNSFESLSCDSWEVVLPEIVYLPDAGGVKP